MLFTTLPIGYMDEKKLKFLEIGDSTQLVWVSREHAEYEAIDSALKVWGVMANWETDTFELDRDEYPGSMARGLMVGALLVELEEVDA